MSNRLQHVPTLSGFSDLEIPNDADPTTDLQNDADRQLPTSVDIASRVNFGVTFFRHLLFFFYMS